MCCTIMKRGKACVWEGIVLPDAQVIRGLEGGDGYRYLGGLEADDAKHNEMKQPISKEYLRRIRKILKSKLNGGNIVSAIHSRAVLLVRYGAGIIRWSKDELRTLDRKTRKLLKIYRSLHLQADVDRLYVKRAQGGRSLISIEDCVNIEAGSLYQYVANSPERLLIATKSENLLDEGVEKV